VNNRYKCMDCGREDKGKGYKGRCLPCYDRDYASRYRKKYRNAIRAHWKVAAAVLKGILPHPRSCLCKDCGLQADAYDHRDYLKPLDVEPVCHSCNKLRGPGANREAA